MPDNKGPRSFPEPPPVEEFKLGPAVEEPLEGGPHPLMKPLPSGGPPPPPAAPGPVSSTGNVPLPPPVGLLQGEFSDPTAPLAVPVAPPVSLEALLAAQALFDAAETIREAVREGARTKQAQERAAKHALITIQRIVRKKILDSKLKPAPASTAKRAI